MTTSTVTTTLSAPTSSSVVVSTCSDGLPAIVLIDFSVTDVPFLNFDHEANSGFATSSAEAVVTASASTATDARHVRRTFDPPGVRAMGDGILHPRGREV